MSRRLRLLAMYPRRYILQGVIFLFLVAAIFFLLYFAVPSFLASHYWENQNKIVAVLTPPDKEAGFVATHAPTPSPVKGIYVTSWVAGSKEMRSHLIKIAETTEINSMIIDIKDYSGRIAFPVENPILVAAGSAEKRIEDIRGLIAELHAKGIYVVGRITVFQDPFLAKARPDLAVKRVSDQRAVWKDYKGLSYLDPGHKEVWDYIVALAKESYKNGFDELNFDYIRFPSDGNIADIYYPKDGGKTKAEILREFFAYLKSELSPTGAKLSADLFGMTTTNTDDLNIGQVLENALPYFDYVSPMVYPSHYPPRFMGFANPADKPYEVVKFSLDAAVRRTIATSTVIAMLGEQPISTTSKPFLYKKMAFDSQKIRPWLQDFNLGATYTADMVRKQIQATYDSGLHSWMLWNAANRYTAAALLDAPVSMSVKVGP